MLTNCLTACAHLSITVSQIQRDFVKKWHFIIPPCIRRPRYGGSRRNIGTPFNMRKLEWCRYLKVKKFRRYLYLFWRNSRTWQTHGQTYGHRVTAIAALCIASHGKNVGCGTWKLRFFCPCGLNNSATVQDRWVHAARGLALTELSFHSCNVLCDCRRASPGQTKKWWPGYVKWRFFCNCGSNNWETVVDRQLTH